MKELKFDDSLTLINYQPKKLRATKKESASQKNSSDVGQKMSPYNSNPVIVPTGKYQ